jgi:hypothetical protein
MGAPIAFSHRSAGFPASRACYGRALPLRFAPLRASGTVVRAGPSTAGIGTAGEWVSTGEEFSAISADDNRESPP